VERSRRALESADLALLVVDGSAPLSAEDRATAALIGDKSAIVVVNKGDLPPIVELDDLLPHVPRVEISALTGAGIGSLEQAIEGAVFAGQVYSSDAALVSSPRHRDVLRRTLTHVEAALATHRSGLPADLLSVDLRATVNALGEITGETITEGLLETIFSRFCVGK
jgi:tRNA modification GTPase